MEEKDRHLNPVAQVTNFSEGFSYLKEASDKALYDVKDEENGDIIQNVLCLDMIPRYVFHPSKTIDNNPRINPATSLGDVFASIRFLSDKIDNMSNDIEFLKRRTENMIAKNEEDYHEIDHMGQHIAAMESNLRCLRETLTFGELEEIDIPRLKGCSTLEKGNVESIISKFEKIIN